MATKTDAKYDVRAPPRRRQKGADLDEQPVFLRKAYAMISTCPTEIGGWSDSGDTVVIKDAKAFAERIIPTAYKHSNFSSFVRQLNFYGFRKVKSNVLNSKDWWEFRHLHFVRGKPHLLSEIKRSLHFEQGGGAEVSELKREVQDLNDKVHHLHHIIEDLSQKVSGMALQGPEGGFQDAPPLPRRRVRARAMTHEEDEEDGEEGEGFALMEEEDDDAMCLLSGVEVKQEAHQASVPCFSAQEEVEMLQSLWDQHEGDDQQEDWALPDELRMQSQAQALAAPPTSGPMVASASSPSALQELPQILALLSPELKERFVDKLVESVSSRLLDSKGSQMPEIALPLASAALGAFLMSSLSMGSAASHLTNQKVATVSA